MKLKLTGLLIASLLLVACGGEKAESTQQTTIASSADSELKTQALEACNAQLEQVPEDMKEEAAKICQCTVDNMDYAKLQELATAGKNEEAMKLSMETAQKCSGES